MRRSERRRGVKTSRCGPDVDSERAIQCVPGSNTVAVSKIAVELTRRQILQPIETFDDDGPAAKYMKTRRSVSSVEKAGILRVGADENNNKEQRRATSTNVKQVKPVKKPRKLVSNVKPINRDLESQESEHSLEEGGAKAQNHSKENVLKLDIPTDTISDAEEELLSYQKIRELNLKANEDFFASLGLGEAKEALHLSVKKKVQPSQRGLKVQKEPPVPLPRRYSLRIRRIDVTGTLLPEPDPVVEAEAESRLPAGPVPMKNCVYSKSSNVPDDDVSTASSLICQTKAEKMQGTVSRKIFQAALEKVTITERRVAKVVPGRVFSVTWHPSSHSLISVAGDKYGNIGIWDVTSSNARDEDIVRVFRPHISPVSDLFIPPADPHKLYSCSYDASLRCCDFERQVFDEVFSVSEKNDDLFRNFSFINGTSTMLVSQFSGNVSLVDVRTPSTSAEQVYPVSKKSLRTVSVHPTSTHYFITAGVDAKILLWDLRAISSTSPKPIQKLENHTKAISSAYFSPSGHKVLTSSSDDTILIYSVNQGFKLDLTKQMRHNNFTGRWLTKFQPTWHPTVEDVFVSGSMMRPRQIEVFSAEGVLLKALTNENFLGSVCSLNTFHPNETCTLVGANSSGRLHVFM